VETAKKLDVWINYSGAATPRFFLPRLIITSRCPTQPARHQAAASRRTQINIITMIRSSSGFQPSQSVMNGGCLITMKRATAAATDRAKAAKTFLSPERLPARQECLETPYPIIGRPNKLTSQVESPRVKKARTTNNGLARTMTRIRCGIESRLNFSTSFNLIDTSGGLTQNVATRRSRRSPSQSRVRAREQRRPNQPLPS